ncbi:MAG: hypothetical protein ACUVWB_06565 [Anaerolineae bacterium]
MMEKWKRDPQQLNTLVWGILFNAFAIFCAIIVGVPLSVRAYLYNSTVQLRPSLEAIKGTVLLHEPGAAEPVAVSMTDPLMQDVPRVRDVRPGAVISTDETSLGTLTFYRNGGQQENVLGTIQLYHSTRLTLIDSASPRFAGISPHPDRITLEVDAGQVRVVVTRLGDKAPMVEVRTPHSQALLGEGSYSVRVATDLTEVVVRYGDATVLANGNGVKLTTGQRTQVAEGGAPALPMPAAQNLIVNGNFTEPLSPAWQTDQFQASAEAEPGRAEIVIAGGRKAVFFSRMGENGIHSEVGISQVINRDVLDYESLVLRMDVQLLYQSLSGGGYLSSEFPVMVRIDYKDVYGFDRFWVHGFYYQNVDRYPIQADLWGNPMGEQIPHAVWYPYESPNLLIALGDLRPARIYSIRIYASGWNFQSMVSEVSLIAE